MINDVTLGYLIFLCPLLTFVINGLFVGNRNAKAAAAIAVTLNGVSALSAILVAVHYFCSTFAPQKAVLFEFTFLPFVDDLVARIGMLVDPLSVMMLVVISTVSSDGSLMPFASMAAWRYSRAFSWSPSSG